MKIFAIIMLGLYLGISGIAQDISVTFTGKGAAILIDSVMATNLTTDQTVTLPGNETLLLTDKTGVFSVYELTNTSAVFPNPFRGKATLTVTVQNPQTVFLKVQNLFGQVVAQAKAFVQPGENEFSMTISMAGIYIVSLTTEMGMFSTKVICTDANTSENNIQYLGPGARNHNNFSESGLKTVQSGHILGYSRGETIHYKCFSGLFTTIMTDSPITSMSYEVGFFGCTDADRKSYSIVNIGDQTWMAENLAYLPKVDPSTKGSDTISYYYVYGYEGSDVSEGKRESNYISYGVLYNWEAAKRSCPTGWHLPTDEEWITLEKHLGMSDSDAIVTGWRDSGDIGIKSKSKADWHNSGNGDNSSGFNALAGGGRNDVGDFDNIFKSANFWSSSEDILQAAWYRSLNYFYSGIGRNKIARSYGFSVRCVRDEAIFGLIGPQGGVIIADDSAKLEVPAGALEDTILISINNISAQEQMINTEGRIYELTPEGFVFNDSITLVLPFDPTYVDSNSEYQNLGIQIMAFVDNDWIDLPTTIILEENYAMAKTIHFSKYKISHPNSYAKYFRENKDKTIILEVPYYHQGTADWCTFYSISMLAKYVGYPYKGPYYARLAQKNVDQGLSNTSFRQYDNLLARVGIQTLRAKPAWSNVENLCGYLLTMIKEGHPIMINSNKLNHAIVVAGHDGTGFYVNDPGGAFLDAAKIPYSLSGMTMIHIPYDDFIGALGNKQKNYTWIVNSKGDMPVSKVTLNFMHGSDCLIKIYNSTLETEKGILAFNGYTYDYGFEIINIDGATGFSVMDYMKLKPAVSNSDLDDSVAVKLTIKIDGNIVDSTTKQIPAKQSNNGYFGNRTLPLSSLTKIGNHLLRIELTDPNVQIIYDYSEFSFQINDTSRIECNFIDPRDWKPYEFKTFGTQTWMTENLACLPAVNLSDTGSNTEPYYYVYGYEGNNINEAKATTNYAFYGVLYNWPAARHACPAGWHLPSDEEWTVLTQWLINNSFGYGGSGNDIGKSLASTSGWVSFPLDGYVGNDQASNNLSGFNALPGGYRYTTGGFPSLGYTAYFWTASEFDGSNSWYRSLDFAGTGLGRSNGGNKKYGFSIRCIKD